MSDVEMKPKAADSGDAGAEAAHTTDGQAATGVAQTNDSSFATSSSSSTTRDQGSRERKGSGSILRPNRTRARSTSSSMLVRLTTRSSSIMDPSGGTGTSSNGGDDDDTSSRKSRQKYKSGVNWNALSPQNEPFMGEDISQERSDEDIPDPELEEMRAVGGTAAAKKWARQSSIGDPIFASYLRASSEAAAAQAAAQAKAQAQAHAQALAFAPGQGQFAAGSPSQFHSRRNSTLVTPMRSRGELTSTSDESQSPVSDDVLTQAAQQVLGQAREAAVADGGIQEPVAEANGTADGTTREQAAATDADKESEEAAEAAAKAKPVKRKTILGFPTKSKEAKEKKSKDKKKEKESKSKASSRNASTTDLNAMTTTTTTAGEATPAGDAQPEKRQSTNTTSETSTVGRRRRYADTRQLNLLASELAAEALLGPPYADGTAHLGGHMTPEPRRASMMSVMAMSGATGMSTPSNASHADLSSTSPHLNGGLSPLTTLPPPQPAFYAESHRNSGSSASSPYSASPRSGNGELPRFEPPRSAFAKSQQSLSMPNSPFATQQAKLNGLPSDMLVGLGDGPFPTLAPRFSDTGGVDPFGIPIANDGPYDVSTSYQNRTNVYHSPNQVRSRGASTSSTPAHTGSSSNGTTTPKRSVLQMSMHNPETELQGLTKPPKNKSSTFGSRGPSRQVTPSPSMNALKDASKEKRSSREQTSPPPANSALLASAATAAAASRAPTSEAEKAKVAPAAAAAQPPPPQQQQLQQGRQQQPQQQASNPPLTLPKAETKDRSSSRKSIFGMMRSKDTKEADSKKDTYSATPLSQQNQSQQSRSLSTSSDSVPSRPASSLLATGRSNASKSQQSLVKVPSPATSGSFLEPAATTTAFEHSTNEPKQPSTSSAAPVSSEIMAAASAPAKASALPHQGTKPPPKATPPPAPAPAVQAKNKTDAARPVKPIRSSSEEVSKLSKFMAKLAGRSVSSSTMPTAGKVGNKVTPAPPQPPASAPARTRAYPAREQTSSQPAPIYAQMTSRQSQSQTPSPQESVSYHSVSPEQASKADSEAQSSESTKVPKNFAEKVSAAASTEDVCLDASIASAYINSEMAASGFGTRSAYQSTSLPPHFPLDFKNNVSVKPTLAPISDVSYSGSSAVNTTAKMQSAEPPLRPLERRRVSSEDAMKARPMTTTSSSGGGSAKSSARSTDESSASGSSNEGPSIQTPEAEFGLHIASSSNGSSSEATSANNVNVSKPPIGSGNFEFAPTTQTL